MHLKMRALLFLLSCGLSRRRCAGLPPNAQSTVKNGGADGGQPQPVGNGDSDGHKRSCEDGHGFVA